MGIESVGSAIMSVGFIGLFALMAVITAQKIQGEVEPWAIVLILAFGFMTMIGSAISFAPQVLGKIDAKRKGKRKT